MTSNIGSHVMMDTSLSSEEKRKLIDEALRSVFRPEFLNRIDEVISFQSLGEEQIFALTRIQLDELGRRLEAKKMTLSYDEKVLKFLSKKGFDPLYGARPLKRVIQNEVLNPLSKMMIQGKVQGGGKIKLTANDLSLQIFNER